MTIKFKAKYGNLWIKAKLIEIAVDGQYLIECMGQELVVEPEQVVFS